MSIDKIILILILVAIVVGVVALIISPIVSDVSNQINSTPGAADLAVSYIAGQMTQAAWTPTPGTPPPSAADIAADAVAMQINANATQRAEDRMAQAAQDASNLQVAALEATQEAEARATADYWTGVYWAATQTSAMIQTQTAIPPTQTAAAQTQTALPLIATTDALKLMSIQQIYQTQADDLRRQTAQEIWAAPLRLFVLVFAIVGGVFLVFYYVRHAKRVRRLTDDGKVNVIEDADGVYHETNSDNMPTPSMKIDAVVKPEGATTYQQQITTQAQQVKAIEAAARAAQSPAGAFQVATDVMSSQVRWTVGQAPTDLLSIDTRKTLNADWELT